MTHEKGILPDATGFRVYGRVTLQKRQPGVSFEKHFPPDATPKEMREWRQRERFRLKEGIRPPKPIEERTFADDARDYLETVKALSTWSERRQHLLEWVAALGDDRRTESITSKEIRKQRDQWLTVGPRHEQRRVNGKMKWILVDRPLAPSSVNHRLRALQNFFTVMRGRRAPNPVLEVPECDEDPGVPRAIPAALIRAILDKIPDRGRPVKGQSRDAVSKTKARLRVMAWVGLPPAQMMLLTEDDVDIAGKSIWVRRRKKGKGIVGARRPLTRAGAAAMKDLVAADAWGEFSTSSARRTFKRAAAALQKELKEAGTVVDLSSLHPYDLRHSFATDTLDATKNVEALQALLGHADKRTSLRYAAGAVPAYLAAAAAQLDRLQRRKLGEKVGGGKSRAKLRLA